VSVKGTLNFELTFTIENLEELVEKTNMLARILKAEGFEHGPELGDVRAGKAVREGTMNFTQKKERDSK
jgi:hypothetical protein